MFCQSDNGSGLAVNLKHILQEANYLLEDSENESFDSFIQNKRLKRAFVRSIEIIGEAVKNIPDHVKAKQPEVEWKKIASTRDRLIHTYMYIDYEIVWDIIKNKIPELKLKIEELLQKESE